MRRSIIRLAVLTLCVLGFASCEKKFEMGTYGYDREFLADRNIPTIELKSPDGKSKLLIAPDDINDKW